MSDTQYTVAVKENKKQLLVGLGSISIEYPKTYAGFWAILSTTFRKDIKDLKTYKKPKDIIEYIDSIINPIIEYCENKYIDSEIIYYLNQETELLWIEKYKKLGIINYLKNKFKNKKLILLDGNLSNDTDEYQIEHEGVFTFIGQSSRQSKNFLTNQRGTFTKHFVCLQERVTPSRTEIYYHLYDNNLLYKTFYTYNQKNKFSQFHYSLDDGTNYAFVEEGEEQDKIDGKPVLFFPNHWNIHSFCNIITESYFYSEDLPETVKNAIFLTEKIEKSFTAAQPFILVGGRYSLRYLKKIGFKTFDKWWDESYDDEPDEIRMQKIKALINEIGSWPLTKCYSVFKEMIPILNHNQTLNKFYKDNFYKGPFGEFNNKLEFTITNDNKVHVKKRLVNQTQKYKLDKKEPIDLPSSNKISLI